MARVYKKVGMQPPSRTPRLFPRKSASANAPIFLPRPGLNMLRFGVTWYYVACPTRGIGKRGEGGGETFRDISTTAAFRIDRKLSTAVILTHTSSAFDADESKGGNGVLEESCRRAGGWKGFSSTNAELVAFCKRSRRSTAWNLLNSVIKGFLIMLVWI